ncbi:hypothetical protein IGI04_042996 [Brassica rapa subsp. trilocularis]|uniref:Secreted protein n=1 Tax=Brassica rapa subsp. trilocularis TaxID=1813537 RepID=A0ABQ7KH49_BRACM|nr:hypothetical protein IGI04_042996 [Brassica rapa subsp. trilocularis]
MRVLTHISILPTFSCGPRPWPAVNETWTDPGTNSYSMLTTHITVWPFQWTVRVVIRVRVQDSELYQQSDHTYQHAAHGRGLYRVTDP